MYGKKECILRNGYRGLSQLDLSIVRRQQNRAAISLAHQRRLLLMTPTTGGWASNLLDFYRAMVMSEVDDADTSDTPTLNPYA